MTASSWTPARAPRMGCAPTSLGAAGGMVTAELDGVFIYSPEGKLIGRIHLPERCANLCFGGAKRNRLFMAASKSLYLI